MAGADRPDASAGSPLLRPPDRTAHRAVGAAPGRADALRPPEARQGPGPMPAALLEALDAAVQRLIVHRLSGSRRASGVGLGTELAQLRAYEAGDDVRHIDPAASARTAMLHVRVHVPERALTTWIVLDLSPSMAFGSAERLKIDVAEGVALVFARLGLRRAGSVGVVACGVPGEAGGIRVLPPRGSRPGLVAVRRLLEQGVAPDAARPQPHMLAEALARTFRLSRLAGLVVVISDFREQEGWEGPLGALRLRHAVVAVEVGDPLELALPAVGRLSVVDPESGALVRVDSSNRELRERFAALERERREAVAGELRRLGIAHIPLFTDQDWLRELGRRLR
ncbi:MAG TPA: DUF58 domain-containing protein [Solirubrobacteraceae bacterium]|nr:DUF58 domain-containing protein [Solirubrobacteraceae bacterium]